MKLTPDQGWRGQAARAAYPRLLVLPLLLPLLLLPPEAAAQTSFPLADLMPRARGTALGGQYLAGDLLAAGVDPVVVAGEGFLAEAATGTDPLGTSFAAAGARFHLLGRPLGVVFSSLSHDSQQITDLLDRLGVFGCSFAPGDASFSAATLLLQDAGLIVGAGVTVGFSRISNYDAIAFSGAVSIRQQVGSVQVRAGVSDVGSVLSPFASADGTRLPLRLRGGAAWGPAAGSWEFSGEFTWRAGDDVVIAGVGAEWRPSEEGALRLGIVRGDGVDALSVGTIGSIGLTAGAEWTVSGWRVSYAFRPGGILGAGHFIALGWAPR